MNEQPKIIRIVMHDRRAAGGGNAPEPKTPVKPKRKARWPWVVALLLLVAAAGAGVWWWSGRAAELCLEKANAAMERGEYAEAAMLFRKAADRGLAEAQCHLGYLYESGWGVPENPEEAAKWARKAAEQGNADAQFHLGTCYNIGSGVPQNNKEAVKWYRLAAEQGIPEAQEMLGEFYMNGWGGISRSYTEAAKWFRPAAEQGNAEAQYNLAACISKSAGEQGNSEWMVEAAKWLRAAADQGHAQAQLEVGMFYLRAGLDEKAAKWFKMAAEQGFAKAQATLGRCYEEGRGVPQSYEEAVKWYQKAADQGNDSGQLWLATCWGLGQGLPANDAMAAKWFRKAAEQGNPNAQLGLGLLYTEGYGVPKNEEEAKKWLRMSAEQGNAEAAEQLKKLGKSGTPTTRADKTPASARPTPKPTGTGGRTMTLAEYSSAIDANLKRNILMSQAGQYVGAALSLVAQGRGGENLARRLGIELSGRDEYEIDAILRRRGLGDVEDILGGMSEEEIAAISINGYPYIDRLKFWRAATMEYFGGYPLFMEATAGYRRGRRPLPANLGNAEMEEILGSLGIARGNRLDDSQKEFAKFASHFDLDNREDREAFAQALVAGCVAMKERNLALQRGMSADEVFRRIKDIAAILAAEAGMPEAAIVRSAAAKPASAGTMERAGNPAQTASHGGAGAASPAASLSAALEAVMKAPTQENFERVEALWNGLPEERKTALQAGVMGAFCAMLLEKGDTSEMAKRMKYVDFQALWKAVSETCQACGGTGRVKEKCPECGGSGKCPRCHGSGTAVTAVGRLYGKKIPCPKCKSTGRCPACTGGEKEAKCRACTGSGRVQSNAKCRKAMEENLAEALRICRKEGL